MNTPTQHCPTCNGPLPADGPCSVCGVGEANKGCHDAWVPVLREFVIVKGGVTDGGPPTDKQTRYEARADLEKSWETTSGWASKYRQIDKDGQEHNGIGWYEQQVIDPDTGTVLHKDDRPLTEKPPSGSARRRK
jgi:hypothetical protein